MGKARDLANVGSVASQGLNFRNRIINGAMMIDQRNNGASVTANGGYYLDRWEIEASQSSKLTIQQQRDVIPVGFNYATAIGSSSSYSVGSSDNFGYRQIIEGFNCADLGWGTANAQPVTLSFWVRSSLTGTFGGAFCNGDNDRSYPFTYIISSANTWEQKSITIAGDTTGIWGKLSGRGIQVRFGLGAGSTFSGTAGAWTAGDKRTATGAVSLVGTNGATFYITGVQLEKGTQATPFEHRPSGTELALCQRYYQILRYSYEGNIGYGALGNFTPSSLSFNTAMRPSPTVTWSSLNNSSGATVNGIGYFPADGDKTSIRVTLNLATGYQYYLGVGSFSSEL